MKRLIIILILSLLLSGCLQLKEHLVINKDGSGTYEYHFMIPEGILYLVDTMMGGKLRSVIDKFGKPEGVPTSVLTDHYLDMEFVESLNYIPEISTEIAKIAGFNIEFINFKSEKKDGDLYVDFKYQFDDIIKLLNLNMTVKQFELVEDSGGNLVYVLKQDVQRANQTKAYSQELKAVLESENNAWLNPEMKEKILSAMRSFKDEYCVTMPNEIKGLLGMFTQRSPDTACFGFAGDFLKDLVIIDKNFGITTETTKVICGSQGLTFKVPEEEVPETAEVQIPADLEAGSIIKVYFKDGTIQEGELVEVSEDYLKVDIVGIPLTYFKDRIQRVKQLSPPL